MLHYLQLFLMLEAAAASDGAGEAQRVPCFFTIRILTSDLEGSTLWPRENSGA